MRRKIPCHGDYYDRHDGLIIMLTVCTKNRRMLLANEHCHQILRELWKDHSRYFVGRYIVMPDHVHLFVAPAQHSCSLEDWVAYWKSAFSIKAKLGRDFWQRDFWDKRIRREEGYLAAWEYMAQNPVRKSLVNRSEDWIYQGEIYRLEMR